MEEPKIDTSSNTVLEKSLDLFRARDWRAVHNVCSESLSHATSEQELKWLSLLLVVSLAAQGAESENLREGYEKWKDSLPEKAVVVHALLGCSFLTVAQVEAILGRAEESDAALRISNQYFQRFVDRPIEEAIVLARLQRRGESPKPDAANETDANYHKEVIRQRQIIAELRHAIAANRAKDPSISQFEESLFKRIREKKLTYLSDKKLALLSKTCTAIETQQIYGDFIEAGCALGGSSILIASLKIPTRRLLVYDVFEMIPPPGPKDPPQVHERFAEIVSGRSSGIGGDEYYGYMKNLLQTVKANFLSFDLEPVSNEIYFFPGLVQEKMKLTEPVAFAHLDLDWYEPVTYALSEIAPRLSMFGSIIVDDYYDWGGCRTAVDEFLEKFGSQFSVDAGGPSLKITRIKDCGTD